MKDDELVLRSLGVVGILLMVAALCYVLLGCSPPKAPTPGGLVIFYEHNEKRLSPEKAAELDARHAALLECLPHESFCRTEPPTFAISGDCDYFFSWGEKDRGTTYLNGTRRIILPGSLGAAAHEMTHYYTCIGDHADRKVYLTSPPHTCGDTVDAFFRRMYPPKKCEVT